MRIYQESDVVGPDCPSVSVIGYGNLGKSIALNARDSGARVVIGSIRDDSYAAAERDGFQVFTIAEATRRSDVVFILVPDEHVAACFRESIAPSLKAGQALALASGYALAYGLIVPPEDVDVVLAAPRMLGGRVRDLYLNGSGPFAYLGVEIDHSGAAEDRLLRLARAVGFLRNGALQSTAQDEALVDLLVEQTFGPMMGVALQATFEAGTRVGLPPEMLVAELYMSGEMEETFHTFATVGFFRSLLAHGFTAPFGGYIRSLEIDADAMTNKFEDIARHIADGHFAIALAEEESAGRPFAEVLSLLVAGSDPLSAAEDRLREARDT